MNKLIETKITRAVHNVEPSPGFSEELLMKIENSAPASRSVKRRNLWVWVPASLVLALTVVLFVVSPQTVLGAFQSLLDYLPGIGFVEEGALYLSEPVSVEQDGMILTINQVVVDEDHTLVSYQIQNLLPDGAASCFYDINRLVMADGTSKSPIGGSSSENEEGGLEAAIEFLPLPKGVSEATLFVSMEESPKCSNFPDWNVAFSLGSVDHSADLLPVVENIGSQSSSGGEDIRFLIDRMVVMDDGYLLFGHAEFDNQNWWNINIDLRNVYALDANGQEVPLERGEGTVQDNGFVIKTGGKDFSAPLTLYFQEVEVSGGFERDDLSFTVDIGAEPQVGQSWEINREFEIGEYPITIQSMKLVQSTINSSETDPDYGFALTIETDKVNHLMLICSAEAEDNSGHWWSQSMPYSDPEKPGMIPAGVEPSGLIFETYFSNGIPTGKFTCTIDGAIYPKTGSWQTEWMPSTED